MNTKADCFNKDVNISHKKLEVCRLCGEKSSDYIPIFEDEDNYIPEKISRCLPIIIFPNDSLPSNVCRCCLNYLNISCKLILNAVAVDEILRIQLDQKQKDAIFTDEDCNVEIPYEEPKISEPNIKRSSLKELKKQAIVGPVECDLCDLNFQDVDTFDIHMEQCHFLKWRCSLCDDSFDESNKLIVHKILKHNSNIAICNSCKHINQNNKQKITNENDHDNEREVIGGNIQNDQNIKQQIIDEKNIQKNRETDQKTINKISYEKQDFTKDIELTALINLIHASIKQIYNRSDSDIKNCKKFLDFTDVTNVQNDESDEHEITIEKNVQNYQNIKQNNIQNNCETEQKTIDRISYEKQDVTFTKDVETAASINLPIDTEIDITEIKSKDDLMQALIKHIDNRSDSDMDKTKKFLEQFKMLEQRELWFCETCKIYFANERYFNVHNKIHEEKTMTCIMCFTKHSSGYDLFLHKRERHNMYKKVQLKYMCNSCGKFFTHSWTWNEHNEDECSRMAKYCKYCNAVFSTDLKLTHHLRKHKSEMFNDPTVTVYKCITCSREYVDKEFYEKHRNVHDPECWDKFRCTECGRPFRDKFHLQEHQFVHRNIKPYQCHICERSFVRLHAMRTHHKIHVGHKCNQCNAVFKNRLDLTKHVQEIHGLEPSDKFSTKTNYICRFCGKKLTTYKSLTNHERIHTGEMPYSCPICNKSFRTYNSRWTHVQQHQKETVVCEYCEKCFSCKRNLIKHILTHLPVQARQHHVCNICGKKFLRKSQLIIHNRIHNQIRSFQCDVCSLSFTQKGDMKQHKCDTSRKTNLSKV